MSGSEHMIANKDFQIDLGSGTTQQFQIEE